MNRSTKQLTIFYNQMKNRGIKIIKLIILFLTVTQLSVSAQNPKYFIISGKVLSETETSDNITVQIIKNNKPAIVSQIPVHRRFRLELDYNTEYQLTFTQNDHISKTIVVNTEIPSEIMQREHNLSHFLMAVKLEKSTCEAENIINLNSIQHITYSPENEIFTRLPTIFDLEYVEQNSITARQTMKLNDSKSKSQNYHIF